MFRANVSSFLYIYTFFYKDKFYKNIRLIFDLLLINSVRIIPASDFIKQKFKITTFFKSPELYFFTH